MTQSDLEGLARAKGLARVGARPRLVSYVGAAWSRRGFAIVLARFHIQATLSANRLGLGWVVLRPTLNAALYGVIFGLIMSSATRPSNFIPFLIAGVFTFEFFSQSLSQGAKAIVTNAGLVKSLSFPRVLLPLSVVIQRVFELVPMMVVLGVVLVAFGEPVTWRWILAPVVLGMMTIFNFGVALIAARLTAHVRDVGQLVPLFNRLIFYSSGIFYSIDKVAAANDMKSLASFAQLNPVYDFISIMRAMLVSGNAATTTMWVVAISATVTVFVGGLFLFWHAEERYGDL